MNNCFVEMILLQLLVHLLITTLGRSQVNENFNSYKGQYVEDCALDRHCRQALSYSVLRDNFTDVFYFIDQPPVDVICLLIIPFSRHLKFEGMPWLQLVFDELFCQDTKKEQLLDINYHYIRLPIALPEGLYSISFHLSARNSSQVIKVEDQLHYIYSIEASSTSSNLQIPFHYQLLAPNYGSIISRKVKILFYPNFHALNSYEGVVMSIDGVLNNWLGNTADIVATETDLEPASWFITLLPVQSGEIIHNLQYQLAVSASPVKETLTASLLSRSRYLQNFNISPHLESFIPYENIIHGYPTYHYLEVVLTDEEILQQRLFVSHLFKSYQRSSRDLALQLIQEKLHWKRKLQLIFQDRRYYRKPSPFLAENKVNNGEDNQRKSNQQRNRKGSTSKQIPSDSTGFINVCITGGNDMDGQKRIWLQQAEHLDANKYQFYYLMSLHNGMTTSQLHEAYDPHSKKNTVYYYLQQLIREKNRTNIHIADSRYNTHLISMEDIEDIPFGETLSASMIWQQNKTKLYEYLHSRYELAEGNLENITPSWCKLFYSQMKEELIQNECHMIVYGNARGFNTDIFITDVSRSLGIPSITELLNLYLDDRIIPDVIVAPSHHSLLHPTIQDPIISNQYNYHYQYPPLQVVIQPSVNPRFFDSSPYRDTPSVIPAKSCSRMNGYRFPYSISKEVDVFVKHYPCILIGFIARISNEKNPGLFVQMAYHLLQKFPFVRFRFIGNGIVKEQVELLTKRLNIDYAIDFVGWISSEDLPRHLADIDIVVNPSLRGWSETFCISNIEIMSMGIPLVTFAVGGIGEYVTAPASWTKWKSKEGKTVMHKKSSIEIFPASWQRMEEDGDDTLTDEVNEEREGARDIPPFEVVDNALLLNTADPRQMSEALFYLITHPPIAKNIGEAGRRSIEHYFTTVRQIQQYDHLYHSIYETRWGPLSK